MTVVSVEKQKFFVNGWFCKRCDKLTEHVKTARGLVCCECGSPLPGSAAKAKVDVKEKQRAYRNRPDVKEKQRAYRNRPDVKEKKRETNQRYLQRKRDKLQKLLESSKMEAS